MRLDRHNCRFLFIAVLVALAYAEPAAADQATDQYTVAAGHYSAGRWALAIDEFATFIRAYPEDRRSAQALFFSGEAQVQLGQFADAGLNFQRLLDRYPQHALARQAMFRRAEAAYLGGQHKQARELLDEFNTQFPEDSLHEYTLPYLGDLILEAGDAENARRVFAKAADVFPQGAMIDDCHLGLARADEMTGRTDAARNVYREMAEQAGPHADQAHFRWGVLENATGNYDGALEALAAFDSNLAASPLRDKAQLERGWALHKLRRFAEAKTCFAELTAQPPDPNQAAIKNPPD